MGIGVGPNDEEGQESGLQCGVMWCRWVYGYLLEIL